METVITVALALLACMSVVMVVLAIKMDNDLRNLSPWRDCKEGCYGGCWAYTRKCKVKR